MLQGSWQSMGSQWVLGPEKGRWILLLCGVTPAAQPLGPASPPLSTGLVGLHQAPCEIRPATLYLAPQMSQPCCPLLALPPLNRLTAQHSTGRTLPAGQQEKGHEGRSQRPAQRGYLD